MSPATVLPVSPESVFKQPPTESRIDSSYPTAPPPPPSNPTHEEHQYLNLIRTILKNGEYRPDR